MKKSFWSQILLMVSFGESPTSLPAQVVLWSPLLTFKLGGQGSSSGWTSTQGLKIIEQKGLPLH